MTLHHSGTSARALVFVGLLLALLIPRPAHAADSPVGYWTTIDDDGKTPTSVIQIFPKGKKLFGRIVQLINPREKDPKCTACEGDRKNQRIIGMEILRDFEQDDDEWSGGHILDPREGKEYKCNLELVEGGERLKVRGYIGIALLGRTQYWQKSDAPKTTPPAAQPAPSAPPKAAPKALQEAAPKSGPLSRGALPSEIPGRSLPTRRRIEKYALRLGPWQITKGGVDERTAAGSCAESPTVRAGIWPSNSR